MPLDPSIFHRDFTEREIAESLTESLMLIGERDKVLYLA